MANGLAMVNAWPLLAGFYVIFFCALGLFNAALLIVAGNIIRPRALHILSPLWPIPLEAFVLGGVMASLELIIIKKAWRPAALWYGGRIYFLRFLLILLIFYAVKCIISFADVRLSALVLPAVFRSAGAAHGRIANLLLLAFFLGVTVIVLALETFALATAVVDNLRPHRAIRRSFRLISSNRAETLCIFLSFGAAFLIISIISGYALPKQWLFDIIERALAGYLRLLLMATLIYFNRRISLVEAKGRTPRL